MGRPLSMTGTVYGEHLEDIEMAIGRMEKIAIDSITNRTVDGVEFAGYMGDLLKELRAARLAYQQLREIYEENKRSGGNNDS